MQSVTYLSHEKRERGRERERERERGRGRGREKERERERESRQRHGGVETIRDINIHSMSRECISMQRLPICVRLIDMDNLSAVMLGIRPIQIDTLTPNYLNVVDCESMPPC